MSDRSVREDYLWDGSGPADPDVAALEQILAPLRYEQPLDEVRVRRALRGQRARRRLPALAAVAAVLLCALAGIALWPRGSEQRASATRADAGHRHSSDGVSAHAVSWAVSALEGAATADGQDLTGRAGQLGIGVWLETGAAARARLDVADIGALEVREHSRLRIVASGEDEHRVQLARGQIHAFIDAPPRLFLVETAAAVAVDLGCEYTLQVDEEGRGVLHVMSGFVALERDGKESFVPAGAKCDTRPGLGPGTPYAEDASAAFLTELRAYDERPDDTRLDRILSLAERRDSVSLWNLFTRAEGEEMQTVRARIYERLATLVPPPEGATRARLLAGDADALMWWRLALEDVWFGYDE